MPVNGKALENAAKAWARVSSWTWFIKVRAKSRSSGCAR